MSFETLKLLESRAKDRCDAAMLALQRATDAQSGAQSHYDNVVRRLSVPLPPLLEAGMLQVHSSHRSHLAQQEISARLALEQSVKAVAEQRGELMQAGLEKAKVGKLIASGQARLAASQAKREQREVDAYASQAWLRRRAADAVA